jgi:hypothetical protein
MHSKQEEGKKERVLSEGDLVKALGNYENWVEVIPQNMGEVRELEARGYLKRTKERSHNGVVKDYVEATNEALEKYFWRHGNLYQKLIHCILKKSTRHSPEDIKSNHHN